MDQHSTRTLWTAGRTAAVLVAAHAALTLWIVGRPQRGPMPLFESLGALLAAPSALLAGQIGALAGFLYLAVTLRAVARSMARSNGPDRGEGGAENRQDPQGPNGPTTFEIVGPSAAAVVFGLCYASGLWLAARGLVGPTGLASLLLLPGALVLLGSLRGPDGGRRLNALQQKEWVSRLRGASILVSVTALVTMVASGSLIGGSLLPAAMLRHLPNGPPPSPDQWAVQPAARPAFAQPPASPVEAGEAVHALLFAGAPRSPQPLERAPVRRHAGWWPLESPPTLPSPPHEWAEHLFRQAQSGELDDQAMAFLRIQSLHPANDEFDRLTAVPSADIAGTRWHSLTERPVASFELPVPRYVELWNGVRGRIAGATYVALQGDPDEARRRLETVVQLGRLLNQDGPLTLDAVLGASIAEEGGLAAQSLDGPRMQPARASTGGPPGPPPTAPTPTERLDWLKRHEAALQTPEAPRGIRWEAFTLVNSFLPCATPSATLWGTAPTSLDWRAETGATLASLPSEQEMARVLSEGYLGTRAGGDGWGWLPKVLGATLGDRPVVTHCAPLVSAVMGLY